MFCNTFVDFNEIMLQECTEENGWVGRVDICQTAREEIDGLDRNGFVYSLDETKDNEIR